MRELALRPRKPRLLRLSPFPLLFSRIALFLLITGVSAKGSAILVAEWSRSVSGSGGCEVTSECGRCLLFSGDDGGFAGTALSNTGSCFCRVLGSGLASWVSFSLESRFDLLNGCWSVSLGFGVENDIFGGFFLNGLTLSPLAAGKSFLAESADGGRAWCTAGSSGSAGVG
jgi:hypothetical protein